MKLFSSCVIKGVPPKLRENKNYFIFLFLIMPPRPNKYKGIQQSNKKMKNWFKEKFDAAKRFIFTIYLTGISRVVGCLVLLLNGSEPPSEKLVTKAQTYVCNELYYLAQKSAEEALANLSDNAVVSIDGSWTNRRNSLTFILDVIDVTTKKIIAFEVLDKGENHRHGNYKGPSNLMEAEAFRRIIPKLMKTGKIKTLVKDGDTKLEKIIEKYNWSVQIHYDLNHRLKNWPNLFKTYNKLANGTLRGLKERVRGFLEVCLYDNLTTAEKVEKFMNSYYHFLGNHTNCPNHGAGYQWPHRNDPIAQKYLMLLLNKSAEILKTSFPYETTNYNENYHSVKSKYVPKAFNLGNSFIGRLACSILQYNKPYDWVTDVMEHLGFNTCLPTHIVTQIIQILHSQLRKMKNQYDKKSLPENKRKKKQNELNKQCEEQKGIKNPLSHE